MMTTGMAGMPLCSGEELLSSCLRTWQTSVTFLFVSVIDMHLVDLMMDMPLGSVSPNMVPGNTSSTSSSQPVTERSGNRTCREGVNLGINQSSKLDLCRLDHPSTV